MTLEKYLGISKELAKFIEKECLYKDIGEQVLKVTSKGIYLIDIITDINHYTVLPMGKFEFLKHCMPILKARLNKAQEEYFDNKKPTITDEYYDYLRNGYSKLVGVTMLAPNSF